MAVLRAFWHKPNLLPLAHSFDQQHPLFTLVCALEGALFSRDTLFQERFVTLKSELLKKDVFPPCWR